MIPIRTKTNDRKTSIFATVIILVLTLAAAACNSEQSAKHTPSPDVADTAQTSIDSLPDKPVFNVHIAPIIHANCSSCHHVGGYAPFPLLNYRHVAKRAKMVREVTQTRYMPPWKADRSYRHFKDERGLSNREIQTIGRWVEQGATYGDPNVAVEEPVFEHYGINKKPDLTLHLDKAYQIPATGKEYFVTYVYPLDFKEDVNISAFEFVPQNKPQVHHAWFFTVNDKFKLPEGRMGNKIKYYEEESEFHLMDNGYGDGLISDNLLYTPGYRTEPYPPGIAKKLSANTTHLLLQIHYISNGKMATDSSYLNLHFAENGKREVRYILLEEEMLENPPFIIPPDSAKHFRIKSPEPDMDISLLRIAPHMHYLGKKIWSYAVTPQTDTINLLKINDWDFNWQGIYTFEHPVRIPQGSKVFLEGIFDNTVNNPANPNLPPIEVRQGWTSKDEMFQAYIEWLPYQEGDEDIDL